MPPGRWRSVRVRLPVYNRLERIAERHGLTSVSRAVAWLLDQVETWREHI